MFLSTGLILFGFINVSQCLLYNKSVDLMTDVLSGYNTRQRPVLEQSDTLNVSVSFFVASIRELDEVAGKFSIVGVVTTTWRDEIVNWTPRNYDGALKIDLKLSDIWYPKLVLMNPYYKMIDLGQDWMMLSVTYEGDTIFQPISIFESTCDVDVTYYPYDTQVRVFRVLQLRYNKTDIRANKF
ncbi:acetylcholine receptor subunit alpha-1-B-like [Mercenaria mercenaria]|uniref:acetylcholine receptor subunit alpha-1-B-like n=1 Tax=Mercenaria mercenaria TaxID=6596 RepID=UPI00234EE702|nr:acetylcholine receptor subunit alpha-1-B-like [Mercenaria mercenaria]